MKVDAVRKMREALAAGDPVWGLWVTMEAPAVTEIAVGLGMTYVVIDCEHGHLGWHHVIAHIRAAVRSNTCVFVRIDSPASINVTGAAASIKRVLDMGADGVIVPNVETADQVKELLAYATYPPAGVRGIGAERATAFGSGFPQHAAECTEQPPFLIPLLESHNSYLNREAIAAIKGIEVYQLGPADHSASKGYAGQWEGPGVADEVRAIAASLTKHGKTAGIMVTGGPNITQRMSEGFRLLTVGMDTGLLQRSIRDMLTVGGVTPAPINTALCPAPAGAAPAVDAAPAAAASDQSPRKRRRAASRPFQVGLTPEFYGAGNKPLYEDFGLGVLDATEGRVSYATMEAGGDGTLTPAQIRGSNGLLVLTSKVMASSLADGAAKDLVALSRFGVGYDTVDVAACTANDVALLIAMGAVDRSFAEVTVGWMIALTHRMFQKHQLTVDGNWAGRPALMGRELRDRVFGAVGFGGIGQATVKLLAPFGMKEFLAYDPFLSPSVAAAAGVKLVSLEELLKRADFVSVHCPLNDKTRGLIGAEQIALMKQGSYLLNTARGGIVVEDALEAAIKSGHLAGAGFDVFVGEPITEPHRLAQLPNVLTAPHCIGWTTELFRDIGIVSCSSLVKMSLGEMPEKGVVNPEVFKRPSFQKKWARVLKETGGA